MDQSGSAQLAVSVGKAPVDGLAAVWAPHKLITGVVVTYNVEKIVYPWRESIASILPICEQVIVVDCGSTDGTRELLQVMCDNDPRIGVLDYHWGDKSEIIAEATNYGIQHVETPWHLNIQADEVLHERGYEEIEWLSQQDRYTAGRVNYKHFVHDFNTTFPFMYQQTVRMGRRDKGWRSIGDGVEYGLGSGAVYSFTNAVCFYHVGKVDTGRSRAAAEKEMEFQKMFVHLPLGFPDPKIVDAYNAGAIDYEYVFQSAKEHGEFRQFRGTYPRCLMLWIEKMEENDKRNKTIKDT